MNKEIILITGASSGFGYLASLHLAEKGYFVIATMRDLSKKELLLSEAKKRNVFDYIDVLQLDVTNSDEILEVKEFIENKYNRLDILINNAGYCLGGMTEFLDLNDWEQQLQTNVLSVVAITQSFIPMMRARRKGKIINIGSVSGCFGFPGMGAYVTSKFALSGFSESLRLELKPFNIDVSIVEAGSFKTKIWEKSLGTVELKLHQDYEKMMQFVYNEAIQSANNAEEPEKVIQLIEKICMSEKPRFRYKVGKGVKLMTFLKGILPWSLIEGMILKKLK